MKNPITLILLIVTAAGILSFSFDAPVDAPQIRTDSLVARIVHHNALTLDAHIDVRTDFNTASNDPGKETADQFDLPKLERGDLDVATLALFADPLKRSPENTVLARKQIDTKLDAIRRFVSANPNRVELASSSADLTRIPGKGKHAILLSFLNAISLGKDISLLNTYYKEGVRVFGFTHAGNNDWADSSRPNPAFGDKPDENGGLTPLGKQAVTELNKLGVIIDVSQLTPAGVFQVVQLSKAPVIASHSAVRGRVENTRNLSNEELRAIAASDGVVHIVAFVPYLKNDPELKRDYLIKIWEPFGLQFGVDDPKTKLDAATYARFQEAYRNFSRNEWRYAALPDYLDAVDYAVRLIGIDHVGLSSDFNHGGGVRGFADVGEAGNVTSELLRRGYSEQDIRKLWGENFLRVFKEVEATAKYIRQGETKGTSVSAAK